jgi:FKBP-type peptidyl-prolyl cis-trans isomerase FklB
MKQISIVTVLLVFSLLLSCKSQNNTAVQEVALNNKVDSLSYYLGLNIANDIKSQGLEKINPAAVAAAFNDIFTGKKPLVEVEKTGPYLNDCFMELRSAKSEKQKKSGSDFLEANKTKAGVTTTTSGLQYQVLTEGHGPKPLATDKVTVNYVGTTLEGKEFDSSIKRGQPATFQVNAVIQGWQEALQLMPVGSKWKLFIPSNLGYGERGAGNSIGPNETLIFEVELLSINK